MMDPKNNVKLLTNASVDVLRNIKSSRKEDFEKVKNVLEFAEKDAKKDNAEVSFFLRNNYTRLCIHI